MTATCRVSALVITLACGSSLALGQPSSLTPESVLAHIREAVGRDRLAASPHGYVASGTTNVAHLNSPFEFAFDASGRSIQTIGGRMPMVRAVDGASVWLRDLGGEIRLPLNDERELSVLSLAVLSGSYLDGSPRLTFAIDESRSSDDHVVLAFTPIDGQISGAVTIDRSTWLPSEWTFAPGEAETKVVLSDYREQDGVKFAGVILTSGKIGEATRVTIDRFERATMAMNAAVPPADARINDTIFDASVSPEIEVIRAPTGHLLVHPRVNGQDIGWFIFDTGAGAGVLSTPVLKELNIETFGEVQASGLGGVVKTGFCRPASLTLGPATLNDPLMVALDLSFLEQYMGRRIAGLIGYNVLARVVAGIDMATPAISIHDSRTFDGNELTWTTMALDNRIAQVEATAEGHTGFFKLDTGAGSGTLIFHEPAVRRLKLLDGRETSAGQSGGVGGTVGTREGVLKWIELGGRRTENLTVDFAIEAKGALADPFTLGNIGGKLLEPFVIVTDYPNNRIAFVPRK